MNPEQPWVGAVAIKDGMFLAVGSAEQIAAVSGDEAEVIDLNGNFAMPGIGDAHLHPAMTMPRRAFCALPSSFFEPSNDDIVDALKACLKTYPADRDWVIAGGATFAAMNSETLTREFLDKLVPDRPAFIEDKTGGHQMWFNTLAMKAAGIDKSFVDNPPEAFFDRTEDGDIKGVANEGAVNPFIDVLPPIDTINTAYSLHLDEVTGSIEKGKFADMIVLNHNLFEVSPSKIHKTEIQRTIIKGEVVYQGRLIAELSGAVSAAGLLWRVRGQTTDFLLRWPWAVFQGRFRAQFRTGYKIRPITLNDPTRSFW